MKFSAPLKPAILIQRYKRFLANVITLNGEHLVLYCPNTGAMTGCGIPGDTIWYSTSTNFKRKYVHTWEITQTRKGELICVNSIQANHLVKEAIITNRLPELTGYSVQKNEVKYGDENSKIDFFLQENERPDCYIEVKSVTLVEKEFGYFPDTITLRGQKHLRELIRIAAAGKRAVLFFVALHSAIQCLSPARQIDFKYAQLLIEAHARGVEVLAYKTELSIDNIVLKQAIPVILRVKD